MLYQTQNPHGGDLYGRPVELDFSVNTNPLGTPPAAAEAVRDAAGALCQGVRIDRKIQLHGAPVQVAAVGVRCLVQHRQSPGFSRPENQAAVFPYHITRN